MLLRRLYRLLALVLAWGVVSPSLAWSDAGAQVIVRPAPLNTPVPIGRPASRRLPSPPPFVKPTTPPIPRPPVFHQGEAHPHGSMASSFSRMPSSADRHMPTPQDAALRIPHPHGRAQTFSVQAVQQKLSIGPRRPSAQRRTMGVIVGAGTAPTGINRWWTYEEGPVNGVGKYMFNIANGNTIVQADDVDVPERGIDLAFRRTYNSQSTHDYAGSDGSQPSLYGDGWTNTFDAHVAANSIATSCGASTLYGVSVFDIDGARYDYTANCDGTTFTAPAGVYTHLTMDAGTGYYFWQKKTGTTYYFISLNGAAPSNPFMPGGLYVIWGRNHNNYVQLTYAFDAPNVYTYSTLNKITVSHSDGQSLTLTFQDFGNYRLLSTLTRPDGAQIAYTYLANTSNLYSVSGPANNAQGTSLQQFYTWFSGGHLLQYVFGPRFMASGGSDGGYTLFYWANSSGVLSSVNQGGYMIPNPADLPGGGQSGPIQPGTSYINYRTIALTFLYNNTYSVVPDSDGHYVARGFGAGGQVQATARYTGGVYLSTEQSWDANNNIIASVDERNNETDYAYDANGNTIAVAAPAVNNFRATSMYSYDAQNNLLAYCDPTYVHAVAGDWRARAAFCLAMACVRFGMEATKPATQPITTVILRSIISLLQKADKSNQPQQS